MSWKIVGLLLAAAIVLSYVPDGAVQAQVPPGQARQPQIGGASRNDTSEELRQMPQIPPKQGAVLGKKLLPGRVGSRGRPGDGAVQGEDGGVAPSLPTGMQNFEGVNNVNGVLPPDTVGDVGPNHYIQMVNLSFAIWNRSGTLLYGPVDSNTLWQGFGGPCQNTNDGDPIVLYDHLADRWLMSQFALPNFPAGPFYQCIAVSQTADPLGAWHRFEFKISDTKLNDYPKFGVWPDGYYMSINQFICGAITCSWAGQGAVAFERDKMLTGDPAARMVYKDLFAEDPNLGGMLPSDLDGPVPPAGTPNPFCEIDDAAWGFPQDQIQCWNFHVDWTNPTFSTFTFDAAHATAAFDSNMCGFFRNCIPQPGTTAKVDAISDRLMYRLQYRNFGTHQTLITNHTVDVNGLDRAGIRWYELRNSGAGWGIHQQGTYSPDANHRWMGSAAMNKEGEIALGFSISSTTVFPGIRVTGRLPTDPLGLMTQGELTIVGGTGSQTHPASRWGDYSMMAADPVDDCAFWYTQEYYAATGSAPWRTKIGAFKFPACGRTKFFTLNPCRVADTRNPDGPSGGPPLAANTTRDFPAAGLCGIPTDAKAIAINVTVTQETDFGNLRLYPTGQPPPNASTINFAVNRVRANNAIIPLGTGGQISVQCDMPPGSMGTTHFLYDVYGYFK